MPRQLLPPGRKHKKAPWLLGYAKDLRKRKTEAEERFETYLVNKKIKYWFQVPRYINGKPVIIDFVFYSKTLNKWFACEVDGGYHKNPEQREKDKKRDEMLEKQGWIPIRIKNEHTYPVSLNNFLLKKMKRLGATDIMMKIK
jgi:very-short-patch-repair endonuclease